MATLEALDASGREHNGQTWRFCGAPDCDVVWFGERTRQAVHRSEAGLRVGVKENQPDSPICYCFHHDTSSIRDRSRQHAPLSAEIRERCRRGEAQCERTNPRGGCCLGDVMALERETGLGAGSHPKV